MPVFNPSTNFPNLLFTRGEPSAILDFDFPGGEQGAYELLKLDPNDYDKTLHTRAKEILLEELKALRHDPSSLSKRLAAVAVIACARSSANQETKCPVGRWDALVGLIYAAEAQYALEAIQLPIPGCAEEWTESKDRTSLPLMPATVVSFAPSDEDSDTSPTPSFCPVFTSLVTDGLTDKFDFLCDGELSPGSSTGLATHPAVGAWLPSRRGRLVLPADEPLRIEGPLMKGIEGIKRSQVNQLKRGVGAMGGGMYLFGAKGQNRRAGPSRATERNGGGVDDLQGVRRELAKRQKELADARTDLDGVRDKLDAVMKIAMAHQPSDEKELELLDEVGRLKDDLRRLRVEAEKVKAQLATALRENDALSARLSSSDTLLSLAHRARPLLYTLCKRVEPFGALLPVSVFPWAAQKGSELVERLGEREESEVERLRRENDALREQLEATTTPSPSLTARRTALSTFNAAKPSQRVTWATNRLAEQVRELTKEVREAREENVDLILQLTD
ncbi:hypothetical protein JCM6882_000340 [Rhodosporidiobolus microsporus]